MSAPITGIVILVW